MDERFKSGRLDLGEDVSIFYRHGGSGPPLLLLHGYPQTHVIWHKVAPALAQRFTLVMPDLRGYGASRGPAPDAAHRNYSKRAMAGDMVALMRALGHDRFDLAGHDRGARVAYRLTLDHPERVRRLASLDTVPTIDIWDGMNAAEAIATYHWPFLAVPAPLPERLIAGDPEFFVRHLIERWAGDAGRLDPDALAQYVAQFRNPATVQATCEDYRAGASCDWDDDRADRAAGRKIGCPLLILWGRGYIGHSVASADSAPGAIWRRWADDVREIALDCGHFIVEEEPEKAAAALLAFFDAS
ncbi:MAG: alpha/beta hydrolase [Dongiaceae bacterium]